MPKCCIDDILSSLRTAPDGVACFKSIIKDQNGLWLDPVAPGDLYEVYLLGLTGSGATATIAIVDWMMKAQRLRSDKACCNIPNPVSWMIQNFEHGIERRPSGRRFLLHGETTMTPFEIARGHIGTTEGPGPENNPIIMAMYASVGHDWVEHDSVAWCAAFVGHCLEQAGIRSTRQLTARSYLDWGVPIEIADAQPGDIGVIPRGSSSWQGHVFFIDRIEGPWVWGLGGNQSDAVNVRRYPVSKLLGVRRAGNVVPAVQLSVRDVQTRLRALGYHEVGAIDGVMGPRTRAAILAFRHDNTLPLVPIIDVALADALERVAPREVAPARATGSPEQSRIIAAANAQIGLGVMGAAGTLGAQIAPALAEAEQAQDLAARMVALFGVQSWLPAAIPWVGMAVFIGVILYALKARAARIEDHRTGRTP